jgi:hypothetical protein
MAMLETNLSVLDQHTFENKGYFLVGKPGLEPGTR